jgi:mannose/fructose/N-acetylgalactosamine-specific phosphotransferase system component IID
MVCAGGGGRTGGGVAMPLSNKESRQLAVRSLFLQVLLNYRTMQGGGYLFSLWPWLKQSHASKARVCASGDYLNAHPVFAAFAIGALRRRLEDGDLEKNPTGFAEWQTALCGPLGMIGDALIWDRWKPLLFSLGVLILLFFPTLEAWIISAIALLLCYNLPIFYLRVLGVRKGYELGEHVLTILGHPLISKVRKRLTSIGLVISGLLFAAGVVKTGDISVMHPVQFTLAFLLMLIGVRRQWPFMISLLVSLVGAMLLPILLELLF